MKIKCNKCDRLATWMYMPSEYNCYYCSDCVPRGCSCMSDDNGNYLTESDGRPLPCCEYMEFLDGIDSDV
jgi:hypothetical protein